MSYKHIIFDFGNVLARFDQQIIIDNLQIPSKDVSLFISIVFQDWSALDDGTIPYEVAANRAVTAAPEHLKDSVSIFFRDWYKYLPPITDTWDFIHELKKKGFSLYILSNAPTYFAEHADFYEITKEFDGILFSAPLILSKPDPRFYQYLFEHYQLDPSDCFFIDDKKENIAAGRALGMDGIIFDGDISKVRCALQLNQ